jgi:hypothetical protein
MLSKPKATYIMSGNTKMKVTSKNVNIIPAPLLKTKNLGLALAHCRIKSASAPPPTAMVSTAEQAMNAAKAVSDAASAGVSAAAQNVAALVANKPISQNVKNAAIEAVHNVKPAAENIAQHAAHAATNLVAGSNLPNNKKAAVVKAAVNSAANAVNKNKTPAQITNAANAGLQTAFITAHTNAPISEINKSAMAAAAVSNTPVPNNKKAEVVAAVANTANKNQTPAEVRAVVNAAIEAAKKGNNVNKAAHAVAEVHNTPVSSEVKNAAINAIKKNNNTPVTHEAAVNATAEVAKTNLPNNKKAAVVEAAVSAAANATKKNNTPAEVKAVVNSAIAAAIKTAESPNVPANKKNVAIEKAANAAANATAKNGKPNAAANAAVAAVVNVAQSPSATPAKMEKAANAAANAAAQGNHPAVAAANAAAAANANKPAAVVNAAAKKPLTQFFNNYQIVGYPKNLVTNVTANKSSNFARRFLNSKLSAGKNKATQITPYGSKYPNKQPWSSIVGKLNNYNLTNAQKNMIRRINIAVAAQNKKGMFEKRRAVNFNLTGISRNNAIAKQRQAVKNQKNKERQVRNEEATLGVSVSKNNNNAEAKKKAANNESIKKMMAAGGFT